MGLRSWLKETKDEIQLALAWKRARNQWSKDMEQGYDPKVGLIKGAKSMGSYFLVSTLALIAATLVDPAAVGGFFGAHGVSATYIALITLAAKGAGTFLSNWLKQRDKDLQLQPQGLLSRAKCGQCGAALALLLALLSAPAYAQDAMPRPSPTPGVEINLHGGAMQFAERGSPDKRDFVYRLTVNITAPAKTSLFGRADYTRTQDGGDLLDPKTFKSIEAFVGGRKDVGAGFSPLVFGGVSWNRDGKIEPVDPRLWTAAAGVRFEVPKRGYVIAAAGHHGPVGGSAFLGSIVVQLNEGASWFGDVAIPLDASRFAARPYTIKAGISARLKSWKF